MIGGSLKSEKPINLTGIDKIPLKYDCINGSIVNGLRKHISYSFTLDKPTGHKKFEEPRLKLFKRMN